MRYLPRVIYSLSEWMGWVAAFSIAIMTLLTTADVVGRYFNYPIRGGIEVVGYSGSVAAAFAIAYTQMKRGHILVDFLVRRLPQRVGAIIDSIVYIVMAALVSVIGWQSYVLGAGHFASGELSMTLGFPVGYFAYGIAFGCAIMCLVLLVDFSNSVAQAVKR